MQGLLRLIGYACFLLTVSAKAAEVFRCEDSTGHVTFTLQGCPADQAQALQSAYNPPPGAGRPVTMAAQAEQKSTAEIRKALTVVAEKQDGCGNRVVGTQRRTAIIRKQIQAGMTRSDVESALGQPDEQTASNGETSYRYKDSDGKNQQVSFDQNGCVKAKR